MKIVFFGCNTTSWLILKELVDIGENVAGVFTMPQTFNISYSENPIHVSTHRSLHEYKEKFSIPFVTVKNKMKDHIKNLVEMKPDLCIVGGWYYMIPKDMIPVPPKGFIGFHPSLLPKYRGGAPVNWAIINGEKKTGTTLFYFDDGMDSGDIIGQREVTIETEDTIREVYDKINEVTVEMVREYVPLLKHGKAPRIRQDHSQATYVTQRSPEDGKIDWTLSASKLYDWIRAQTQPYPGAFTYHNGKLLKIWRAAVEDIDLSVSSAYHPGTVLDASFKNQGILIRAVDTDHAILVTKVGTEKTELVDALDYARDNGLKPGDILGR